MNAITSFIDASNVYGSDVERADRLRKLNSPRGLLDYDYSQRRIMLPFRLGCPNFGHNKKFLKFQKLEKKIKSFGNLTNF